MKKFQFQAGAAFTICSILMTTNVWGASLPIRYNGRNYNYTGKQLGFTYKGKTISLGKTPGIQIKKVNMLPYYNAIVKNGPKVKRSYNSRTGRLQLTNGKKTIVFYKNKRYAYTNGRKRTFTTAPLTVKYRNVNKCYLLIPANFTAKYLGISYTYDSKRRIIHYAKPAPAISASMSAYIRAQQKIYPVYAGKTITTQQYERYVNPSKDTTGKFQFLKLDTYREVNSDTYANHLSNMIASHTGSVFKGKSTAFLNAAKTYDIDPLYFLCQTVHESGYGTSTLAKGASVTKIISGESVVRDSSKNVTGFQKVNGRYITTTVPAKKVYNLYGIKAYDSDPKLCGFSYAYYKGWTSVDRAVKGAAEYVSSQYIHSSYKQNTLYKFRFNPVVSNIWHQYATDPAYAAGIGSLMYKYRDVYHSASLTYDRPSYN